MKKWVGRDLVLLIGRIRLPLEQLVLMGKAAIVLDRPLLKRGFSPALLLRNAILRCKALPSICGLLE
jgi:hypothetical protein